MNSRNRFLYMLQGVVILVLLTPVAMGQDGYIKDIEKARKAKDKELKSQRHSPLQKEDRKRFSGLQYFDVDPGWKKEVQCELIKGGDTLDIVTSSGKDKKFFEYAWLIVDHLGASDTLTAYMRIWPEGIESPYDPYLFVPFTDLTTGETTYGGGRYMDIGVLEQSGTITLDFNLCYNPYCAYGGGFSCPIPPKKNFLDMSVEAGEKSYDDH